jgi:phage terminase Nu1 subunit (DNA packaging protein)
VIAMSLSEIKEEVGRLSVPELDELAACVRLARKQSDPSWLERAAAINARMDTEGGTSEETLRRLDET